MEQNRELYRDDRPFEERVRELLSKMTLEEKAAMCAGSDFWHTKGVERLGVPSVMVTDGPCGLRKQAGESDHLGLNASVTAVSYPTGSCIASSFDRELIQRSGEILGEELSLIHI